MGTVILLLLLLGPTPTRGDTTPSDAIYLDLRWLTRETVLFAAQHDPSVIRLQDGRWLSVVYGGRAQRETAGTWPVGQRLELVYSRAEGCRLIEPGSGFSVPVYDGFEDQHPLDRLWRQSLSGDDSTVGMHEAYEVATGRWEEEITRLHHYFQSSPQVPPAMQVLLRHEHERWQAFRDAHARARGGLYHLPKGTMWGLRAAEEQHQLVRAQALRLLRWLDSLAYADIASWIGED
jgi:hypothetical protein